MARTAMGRPGGHVRGAPPGSSAVPAPRCRRRPLAESRRRDSAPRRTGQRSLCRGRPPNQPGTDLRAPQADRAGSIRPTAAGGTTARTHRCPPPPARPAPAQPPRARTPAPLPARTAAVAAPRACHRSPGARPFVAETHPPGAPALRSAQSARGRAALCWRGAAQRAPAAARSPPASSSSRDGSGDPAALSSRPMVPRRRSAAAWASQGRTGGGGSGGGGARARAPIGPRGRHSPRPAPPRERPAPPPGHQPIDVAEVGGGASLLPAPRAPRTSALTPHRPAAAWRSSLANAGRGRGAEGRAREAAPDLRLCEGLLSRSRVGSVWVRHCPNQALEKAMAPHSSVLAWKIPWMEEPGRLRSMGSLGVGHD